MAEAYPRNVPVLPVRDIVVFPGVVVPVSVGRARSLATIKGISESQPYVAVATQRDFEVEDVRPDDLFEVGTLCRIHHQLHLPSDAVRVLLQGLERIRIGPYSQVEPCLQADISLLPDPAASSEEIEALQHTVVSELRRYAELVQGFPEDLLTVALNLEDPTKLAYLLAFNLHFKNAERQEILEAEGPHEKLGRLSEILAREVDIHELGQRIQAEVQGTLGKTQREFYLREQMRAIQKELGEADERAAEIAELRTKMAEVHLSPEALTEAERELSRLEGLPPGSAEHTVIRTYLDTLLALPWDQASDDELDVGRARQILDEDHYDIEKIKRRILEFLAVHQLRRDRLGLTTLKGPILCFVGPPGVGKTSLGQSIARALGRKFVRFSLGGVRDEAEIRGHRRTYVGALPGRILQLISRAGHNNPVFMLDELDKLGMDFRGDPASALLEVLDPEQNRLFRDHYVDVPFDLSSVLFIATANMLDTVPPALRDRLEVIQLSGYTNDEKVHIARGFLIPRQLRENGLTLDDLAFDDEGLLAIISGYTREAGVRQLSREIAGVCRKRAADLVEGEIGPVTIGAEQVRAYLGRPRFFAEGAGHTDVPGVATGLAWTEAGGEVLMIEVAAIEGQGSLRLTGHLGEVMKESCQAALSFVASHADDFKVAPALFRQRDFHVHVPAGAIPKDGPSAGIAIATAMASLVTGRQVDPGMAMTGEITLRGRVLPVGGIREKVLAARRNGMRRVVIPRQNEADLEDVPAEFLREMQILLVDHMSEVLGYALQSEIGPGALARQLG